MKRSLLVPALSFGVGLAAWFALAGPAARAAEPGSPGSGRSPGAILYLSYCQSCHGLSGKGDGPVAPSLRIPPTDLTELWKRYGTPLDRARVAEYVDGRQLFSFHSSREMPIWGDEFFENAPPDALGVENARRHLIDVLVRYLETLQSQQGA